LKIWGSPAQAWQAVQTLEQLFAERSSRIYEPRTKVEWAKIYSPSLRKIQEIENEEELRALQQSYIRIPDSNDSYHHYVRPFNPYPTDYITNIFKGYFLWPAGETDPYDVFGRNLEALDPIRMDEECFIFYKHQKSIFIVLSKFKDSVDHAIARLRCLLCEVVSRSRTSFRRMILEEMACPDLRQYVKLTPPLSKLKTISDASEEKFMTCQMVGSQLSSKETEEYSHQLANCALMDMSQLPWSIDGVLSSLRYYRGFIRMRIHFGIFGLTEYKKPAGVNHTFSDFIEMMQHPRTKGELRREYVQSAPFGPCLTGWSTVFASILPPRRSEAESTLKKSFWSHWILNVGIWIRQQWSIVHTTM
jgi:hypothetical protein